MQHLSLLPPAPQSWASKHNSINTKDLYGFYLPNYIYCADTSQLQAVIQSSIYRKMINAGYETAATTHCYSLILGATWLSRVTKETAAQNQRPSFPWPFPQPNLLMKPSFSSFALRTESCFAHNFLPQEIHLRIPISSSLPPPKSCKSELALGTDTLLVQKHEGKHPWGTKLW